MFASAAMEALYRLAGKVAQADIAVLISGESGTGKEVMARHLHARSSRANAPFVAVNCAALPETMLEAILFGHEKGVYTGATVSRAGKFEQAHGGTLLLDEITEMPVALQAKLLRVLQEREVERLGGARPVPVDVRVLATSNRDLRQAVADGVIREDLYYRLSVFPLQVPPLREHMEDVVPLAEHFLAKHGSDACTLDASARAMLLTYDWPGNVRELENCMQRALVLTDGTTISADHLVLQALSVNTQGADTFKAPLAAPPVQPVEDPGSLSERLRREEDELLLSALREHGGVKNKTAKALGISDRTLRYKLQDLRQRGIAV